MNDSKEELRRQIAEHAAKAFKLFDEAKQIQSMVFKMPFAERKTVMEKVHDLEMKAVEESQKSINLEKQLSAGNTK